MNLLIRATGRALISWPVFLVAVLGSAELSVLGSGSPASGPLLTRFAVGATGGLATYLLILICWWTVLRWLAGGPRAAVAIMVVAVAGLVRGLIVQSLFTWLGATSGDPGQALMRMVTGALVALVAVLLTSSVVAMVREYRDTTELLNAERQRLVTLLESSTERIERGQAETLARVRDRLEREIAAIPLTSAPSAVAALEGLAGDVVRPLSHTLARDVPEWQVEITRDVPRVRLSDVWRDAVPAVAIRPLLLTIGIFLVSLPAALLQYAPRVGMTALLGGCVALFLLLILGRQWILRWPPTTSRRAWVRIAVVLIVAAAVSGIVAATLDRQDPSAGVFLRLGLISIPLFGLLIAVVSMLAARMQDMAAELETVTHQLRWQVARVNTQQWEQRGVISRALHGPVQTLIHANLLRLRQEMDEGPVDQVRFDAIRDELHVALATQLTPLSDARATKEVLEDIAFTWSGVAAVTWHISPEAVERLDADPLCAHALKDLATEAVSNAIRHGKARHVDIDIAVGGDALIGLSVVDDGTVPSSGTPGLGTVLLTQCTYDWSLTSNGATRLHARLPYVSAEVAALRTA